METIVFVFLFVLMTSAVYVSRGTPLDDYVNAPDANYRYTYLNSFKGPNYAVYLLNMTSQKWLTEEITTTPVWWHYVAVIVPTQVVYRDTGFFWIGGGSWTNGPPDADDKFIKTFTSLAVSTGTVCGVIYQIPFQPTVFQKDPAATQRYEDAIIAWTWRQFLDNGSNPEILLRLPMTKAVVRGMDTLSTFAKTITGSTVNKFVIGGESKRGWTTWTTAAVDKRVVGMVPTVMDLLNIQKRIEMSTELVLPAILLAAAILVRVTPTPLDDYVRQPDSHYSYSFISSIQGPNFEVYILNMTSQKWLTEAVTTKPIWWHYVSVIVPLSLKFKDTAFLFIDGGDNTDKLPSMEDQSLSGFTAMSVSTGAVCAVIGQIPNQPTVFLADPKREERYEDSIIAWTWRTFLENGSNPEILLRLPMTKAVVRGMDTVSTFAKSLTGFEINKFVIGGESKRGWTTWTTAAVDARVVGMVPTVMDLLNIQENLHHHYQSLGGWTFAFEDYYNLNVTLYLDSPNMPWLRAVIDPLTYLMRYTMPKLIVTTSGDEFFLPDDSYYYFNKIPDPKYLRVIPNAEHSLSGHHLSYLMTVRGFFLNILENAQFPNVTWVRTSSSVSGKTVVQTSRPPKNVTVYHATTLSDGRRDFRLVVRDAKTGGKLPHPVLWYSTTAKQNSPTEYEAEFMRPVNGWTAFFIQLQFDGLYDSTLDFTTEVNVVPDTLPFPDCSGVSCFGKLV